VELWVYLHQPLSRAHLLAECVVTRLAVRRALRRQLLPLLRKPPFTHPVLAIREVEGALYTP
jgi:hypothetical protein